MFNDQQPSSVTTLILVSIMFDSPSINRPPTLWDLYVFYRVQESSIYFSLVLYYSWSPAGRASHSDGCNSCAEAGTCVEKCRLTLDTSGGGVKREIVWIMSLYSCPPHWWHLRWPQTRANNPLHGMKGSKSSEWFYMRHMITLKNHWVILPLNKHDTIGIVTANALY